jgi:hypothetical protein
VRALVRDLVARVRAAPPPAAARPPVAAPAPAATPAPSALLVEFTPDGPDVAVAFGEAPRAGTLTVAAHDGPTVALSATPGTRPEVVVLPDGVRVRAGAASVHSYRLLVSRAVRRVTVRVAGTAVAEVTADALRRGEAVVRLAPR